MGDKELETKQLDKNKLQYDPHDEYTVGFPGLFSWNLGFSFYYKPIIIDVRYKYARIKTYSYEIHEQTNFFLQFGLALSKKHTGLTGMLYSHITFNT